MEPISLISSFITIIRAVADIYKRFKRKEEAEALEKAAETIQAKKDIPETEAKKILVTTLTEELGQDRARPVIAYTENIEAFSPFRLEGEPLRYGIEFERLVLQIRKVLCRIQAFELFGSNQVDSRVLHLSKTGEVFYKILGGTRKFHAGDTIDAYLEGYVVGRDAEVYDSIVLAILPASSSLTDATDSEVVALFPEANRSLPYSLCWQEGGLRELKLDADMFRELMEGLLQDVRFYIERVAEEIKKSKDLPAKLSASMQTLKEIDNAARKTQ